MGRIGTEGILSRNVAGAGHRTILKPGRFGRADSGGQKPSTNRRLASGGAFLVWWGRADQNERGNETYSGDRRRQRHRRVGSLQPRARRIPGGGERRRRDRSGSNPQGTSRSRDP